MAEQKTTNSLPPITDLASEAFELLKKGWLPLVVFYLKTVVLVLLLMIPFVVLGILGTKFPLLFIPLIIGGILGILYLSLTVQAAGILILNNPVKTPYREMLKKASPYAFPFLGLLFVSAFLTIPPLFLFIVPGIVVGVLIALSTNELVLGNRGVLSSVRRSIFVVKSHFLAIFVRLLVISVLSWIVVLVVNPMLSSFALGQVIATILQIGLSLYAFCYSITLYKHAEAATPDKKGEAKLLWLGILSLVSIVFMVMVISSIIRLVVSNPEFKKAFNEAMKSSSSQSQTQSSKEFEKQLQDLQKTYK